ncbi:MAG: hypothetical protein WD069_20615 [Planctomycetales bacterium]
MPIKFRCEHCRQFLGISHVMAGTIVDCPTCGRSVRVPREDGRVDPIPKPRLDLADSGLAEALDELGAIGQIPLEPARAAIAPPQHSAAPVRTIEPIALPQPIALPEPAPIEPIAAAAPAASPPRAARPPGSEAGPDPELAALAAAPRATGLPAEPSRLVRRRETANPFRSPAVLAALAGALLAGVAIGLFAGRGFGPSEMSPDQQPAQQAGAKPLEQPPAEQPALSGRITFRTAGGNTMPDAGARVLVFPEGRRGTGKLSIVGLRPGDSAEDFEIARAALRAAGGEVAHVSDAGDFRIDLPAAGSYRVLAISHYQSREGPAATSAEWAALLDAWFDRPTALLGQVRFEFGRIDYKGEQPVSWDHTFEPAER